MLCKRILFLCSKDIKNPAAGGGTWESFRLMNKLVQRGYAVSVLCPRFPEASKEEFIRGIRVIRVGNDYTFPLLAMLTYLASKELRNHDLIVEIVLSYPFFTPLYANKPHISVCWHLPRETYFIELPDIFGRIFGYMVAATLYTIERKLFPKIYKRYPIFTFSQSSRSDLIEVGFDENNVFMLEYALARGIMFTSIGDKKEGDGSWYDPNVEKDDFPSIVCLGRLKKYKGVQDAIKAMSLVVKEAPEAHLFIIGRGEYEPQLKTLTKELSLERNVHFLGYVPMEKKIERLRKAHFLVMPSSREGFPTPVFEALLCGTPSIVSDATGVKESVKQGETGFVYPLGDYKKIAEYAVLLSKGSELREHMQRNTIKWATRFIEEWQKNEEKLLELFEKEMNGLCG